VNPQTIFFLNDPGVAPDRSGFRFARPPVPRVLDISQDAVPLLEIQPGAIWDAEPAGYRLSRITRVDFGGGYEEALYLVGGEPPGRKSAR
jgi:hypothetical protein